MPPRRVRLEEIRQDLADLQDTLKELDAELPALRAQAATEEAKRRLIAIARGRGGVVQEMDQDEEKLVAAALAFREACDRINARHITAAQLFEEAMALSDRFDLPMPTLSPTIRPARARLLASA
jgi:ribosomal protein L29